MDGYTNYIVNLKINGKFYAFAERIRNNNNMFCFFERWKKQGATSVNAVKTATEAHKIAAEWNATYRKNGTYLYS